MKIEDTLLTDFYFRWIKTDKDNEVLEISIEKKSLTPQFLKFLNENGYYAKPGRENFDTEHFVKVG